MIGWHVPERAVVVKSRGRRISEFPAGNETVYGGWHGHQVYSPMAMFGGKGGRGLALILIQARPCENVFVQRRYGRLETEAVSAVFC